MTQSATDLMLSVMRIIPTVSTVGTVKHLDVALDVPLITTVSTLHQCVRMTTSVAAIQMMTAM